MIKTLLLSTLFSALRAYIGSGVYDRIAAEVLFLTNMDGVSGSEKMTRVLEFAKTEAITASQYLIRAVVELTLYRNSQVTKSA